MQVFGLITVVLTTAGCLYFGYTSQQPTTSSWAQNAIGILILVLNASFVLPMVIAIAWTGSSSRHDLLSAFKWSKGNLVKTWEACKAALHVF